jgi:hypothetical protein
MSSLDQAQVEKAIEEEHDRMIKSKVFKPVPRSSVNKKDLIDSTWSIKKIGWLLGASNRLTASITMKPTSRHLWRMI